MKISLNWLKDYLDVNLSPDTVSKVLTSIGLEVEGMEETTSIKGGLEGLVIGQVKACGKHPGADRLSLTKVDVGSDNLLQIVCGAPNVAAGQKVVVATIGTTLYDKEGKDFKIKKGKIRGEASEGMICAEDEIGIGTSHDGIIVLPEEVAVGTPAKDYYKVERDVIYEIGLTPNRSDAMAHIGVAKDLAAALKINHQHSGTVNLPSVDAFEVQSHDLPIVVEVDSLEACPRYSGVSIKGITIKESPDWLKNRLKAIGVKVINNVVDITNFVLHETGQPLHAFDADQIAGQKIIVKTLTKGTPFMALDEREFKLSDQDLMICDGHSKGMCIGGVFGGLNSGVTDKTTNIFLESAHFNARWIRRTSTRHGLRTDAATRFEKGADPNNTIYALKRAVLLFQELAGGEVASDIVDIYPETIAPKQVEVSYRNVNRLIGVDIDKTEIHAILEALEMEVLSKNEEHFTVAVPTNKFDVLREADVIEEILRIYGFNRVPVPSQVRSAVVPAERPDPRKVRNTAGDHLAANGFNEIMAMSLTQSKYFKEILPIEETALVYVNNTSNIHLDVMRPTMLFSALEAVVHNQNRQNADLRLFEFGRTYRKNGEDYVEQEHLSVLLTGRHNPESWLDKHQGDTSYYALKSYVEQLLGRFGLHAYQQTAIRDEVWSMGLKYHRGNQVLVQFGQVQKGISQQMDIKKTVYYADFHWDNVSKALRKQKVIFSELTKYPTVRRDLALVIDNSVKFSDIVEIAKKTGKKILKDINLFDVYENEEQVGKGKKSCAVSFVFEDPSKNLKSKEIDKIVNQLIRAYEERLGAVIRR
ncbi:MAG: phenylalanine--tRNA ligase subunit beta [Bacteroidota bacterium]